MSWGVRSWASTAGVWVVTVAILAGTASLASPAESPKAVRGGRLVVGMRSEAKHFNPLIAVDQTSKTIQSLLHADLVHIDRANHSVYPNLAADWEMSADGRSYTLTLRDGVRFSDGHLLSVDDVLFSFRAYLDERVQSPQRDLLVVGGEPIGVEKVDERCVRFELAQPYGAGERLFDSFHVLPEHVLGEAMSKGDISNAWGLLTQPKEVVGLGPFRLKEVVPGERIVLERNPFYWKRDGAGERLPHLDEVVFVQVPSEEAELLRFRAGEVHVIERMSPESFEVFVSDDDGYNMKDLGPGLEYHFLFFNLNESHSATLRQRQRWFEDREFRRAVAAAIDKDAIVRLVYRERAAPLATHVSPGNHHWIDDSLATEPYPVSLVRKRLAAAGFAWNEEGRLVDDSGTPVEFSILTNAGNRSRSLMASLIQEDLERLGMRVTIASLEFRAYVDRIFQQRDYDAALLALVSGDADPNTDMSFLVSDGTMHVWHLGQETAATSWEAEIDELMREQLTTLDPERRRALYARVQRIMFDYQPIVPLVSPHVLVGAQKRLGNFRPGILPPYTLWNAEELFLLPATDP